MAWFTRLFMYVANDTGLKCSKCGDTNTDKKGGGFGIAMIVEKNGNLFFGLAVSYVCPYSVTAG